MNPSLPASSNLYVVRHGQTSFNAVGTKTFTGWIDVGLSDVGVSQMRALAARLADVRFDVAYTSRLVRCIDSLNILLEPQARAVPVVIDDRIIERDYGDLSGRTHADVRAAHPDQYSLWHRSYDVPPPGGESVKMVEKRVYPFVYDLLAGAGAGRNLLVCGHGNSIRCIRAYLEDLTVEAEMSFEVTQEDYFHYRVTPDPGNLYGARVDTIRRGMEPGKDAS